MIRLHAVCPKVGRGVAITGIDLAKVGRHHPPAGHRQPLRDTGSDRPQLLADVALCLGDIGVCEEAIPVGGSELLDERKSCTHAVGQSVERPAKSALRVIEVADVPASPHARPGLEDVPRSLGSGISMYELSRFMGSSLEQISKTYGHLLPDSIDRTRSALDAFVALDEVVEASAKD